jgi:hypothetical protein
MDTSGQGPSRLPCPPPALAPIEANMGICGDWLVSPNVEGAALSGIALAEKIAAQVRCAAGGRCCCCCCCWRVLLLMMMMKVLQPPLTLWLLLVLVLLLRLS